MWINGIRGVKLLEGGYEFGTMHINVQDHDYFTYDESDSIEEIIGVEMAQHFIVRDGLKRFGDQGEKSVSKELTQMHNMHTYYPVDPKNLTKKQRMDALNSLMLLIENHNGAVNARACADGIKQIKQENYSNEDSTLPTWSNEGVMITYAIEANE